MTVIATGFNDQEVPSFKGAARPSMTSAPKAQPQSQPQPKREPIKREEPVHDYGRPTQQPEEALDIPTFLRNRNRRR